MTVGTWLLKIQERGSGIALKFKAADQWKNVTWDEYLAKIISYAQQMKKLGLSSSDHVGILSSSRLEWAVTDMAIVGSGLVSIPLYANLSDDDLLYVINHSELKLLIIENDSYQKQIDRIKKRFINSIQIKAFEDFDLDTAPSNADRDFFFKACATLKEKDIATIVYTSGTTGTPKGVVLTHESIASEVTEIFSMVGVKPTHTTLSFLPYAHVMGRAEIWGNLYNGHTLAFAESIDKLKNNLIEVKPDFIIAVPRIFEKIYSGILAKIETQPLSQKIFQKAIEVASEVARYRTTKQAIPWSLLIQYETLSRIAFAPIKKAFGGNLLFAVSGGAPLAAELTQFFSYCGIQILEGYGLTETCAAVTVNTRTNFNPGTVGNPVGDVKIKFAADGEILIKSKTCMKEYFKNPEATAQVMVDGYFATGDIGEFTKTGQLKITDRKKDLIKTANGKYVAPQKLEGLLKQESLISQVLIHGDQRKFVSAIISVEEAQVKQWAQVAKLNYSTVDELYQNPALRLRIQKQIQAINSLLASHEAIKKFEIVSDAWTIESGALTPSMKIKRKFLEQKYQSLLGEMYE